MARGALTPEVQAVAKENLEYEIDVTELRLMPYVQYTMMNSQKLDPNHMNQDDRDILTKWREKGFITGGMTDMTMTQEFWTALNAIMYVAYVDRSD